jgi:hypothetical protein
MTIEPLACQDELWANGAVTVVTALMFTAFGEMCSLVSLHSHSVRNTLMQLALRLSHVWGRHARRTLGRHIYMGMHAQEAVARAQASVQAC